MLMEADWGPRRQRVILLLMLMEEKLMLVEEKLMLMEAVWRLRQQDLFYS